MSERVAGFYWVKIKGWLTPRWEPAEWIVEERAGGIHRYWFTLGWEVAEDDGYFEEIGQRVPDYV